MGTLEDQDSKWEIWSEVRTEKIFIIQGPFHPPQLFPQCKYQGKQRLPILLLIIYLRVQEENKMSPDRSLGWWWRWLQRRRNRRMDSRFVSMEDYLGIVNCNSSHQRADTDSVSKSVTPQSTYISFARRLWWLWWHMMIMAMMSVNVVVEIDEVRVISYKSFNGKAHTPHKPP